MRSSERQERRQRTNLEPPDYSPMRRNDDGYYDDLDQSNETNDGGGGGGSGRNFENGISKYGKGRVERGERGEQGRGGWGGGRGGGGRDEEEGWMEESKRSWALFGNVSVYFLASVFMLGLGAGIAFSTLVNTEPQNVASREVIDSKTPNPDVCLANGMSAMVLDQRLFISFNPFNVYVSQAEVKPGCVLRQSNWSVLESRNLVNKDMVRDCKRNMNTFGFVGDLRESPEVSCVYHSETAENLFLKDPEKAVLGDGYQPK
eukprot:TRINITY_DN121_c0_g1_i1.p1 TRINITY_DN121_c0_g1~~TRINITY_DN121_c0_g1_i1.p1  ORF type:complete len:260 (-),score=50.62 TRINITY_DN121_c0_g1_i1:68-847(-)